MGAAKAVDAYGHLAWPAIQVSDADQTYTQASLWDFVPGRTSLGDIACEVLTETWARLPPEARPKEWAAEGRRDAVVRFIRALYGHLDVGGMGRHIARII